MNFIEICDSLQNVLTIELVSSNIEECLTHMYDCNYTENSTIYVSIRSYILSICW
jgi:hypothetical protein